MHRIPVRRNFGAGLLPPARPLFLVSRRIVFWKRLGESQLLRNALLRFIWWPWSGVRDIPHLPKLWPLYGADSDVFRSSRTADADADAIESTIESVTWLESERFPGSAVCPVGPAQTNASCQEFPQTAMDSGTVLSSRTTCLTSSVLQIVCGSLLTNAPARRVTGPPKLTRSRLHVLRLHFSPAHLVAGSGERGTD